jgi:hypothetical protein
VIDRHWYLTKEKLGQHMRPIFLTGPMYISFCGKNFSSASFIFEIKQRSIKVCNRTCRVHFATTSPRLSVVLQTCQWQFVYQIQINLFDAKFTEQLIFLRCNRKWQASQNNLVGTVTTLRARYSKNCGSITMRDKRFIFPAKLPGRIWGIPSVLFKDIGGSFFWG